MTSELLSFARECASAGYVQESEEYLARIKAWREYWRPERVRVLLIAESHVAEQPGDLEISLRLPATTDTPPPSGFCRLVYCLGYGENEICLPPARSNAGTIQYWDFFGQLAGGTGNAQPRKSASRLEDRLRWKIDTLHRLKERGIYLVDASVVALYAPGGRRLITGRRYQELLRQSFERFVWPEVSSEPLEHNLGVSREP
jgi:hypothetical protein